MSKKGYNLTIKQLNTAVKTTTASGTPMIKFRGETTLRGETRERTVVAMGKAAALLEGKLRKGNSHDLRVLFDRAPANEDGKRGGEFLSVIDIPQPREQKAA